MKKLTIIALTASLMLLYGCVNTNEPKPTPLPSALPEATMPGVVVPEVESPGNAQMPGATAIPENGMMPNDGMMPENTMVPDGMTPGVDGLVEEPMPNPQDMPPIGETITATNIKNVATKQSGVDDAVVLIANDEKYVVALKMRKDEKLTEMGDKSIKEAIGKDKMVKITTDSKHYASAMSLEEASKGEKIPEDKITKLFDEIK